MDGEMASSDIKERLSQLNPSPDRKSPLYIYSDAYANHLGLPRANLLSEIWRTTMKRILTIRGVKLWVVDNIASLTGSGTYDENLTKDWGPINSWLLDLRFSGIATHLLHHTNKAGGQRGASSREDHLDSSILLKQPQGHEAEDGADFIFSFTKSRFAHDDLHLIQDVRFTLRADGAGRLQWQWRYAKAEIKGEILEMIDRGTPYKDIASALSVSPGLITKTKKQAVKDGIMNDQGKLL